MSRPGSWMTSMIPDNPANTTETSMAHRFCRACGRLTKAVFCSDQCRQVGPRSCPCGRMLLRAGVQEVPIKFRQRKHCSDACRYQAASERRFAQWRKPEVRARMIRGLQLSQSSADNLERVRKHMQDLNQNSTFIAGRRKRRLFSPEQVRAIRADPRSSRLVGADYGVEHAIILGIRSYRYYTDV